VTTQGSDRDLVLLERSNLLDKVAGVVVLLLSLTLVELAQLHRHELVVLGHDKSNAREGKISVQLLPDRHQVGAAAVVRGDHGGSCHRRSSDGRSGRQGVVGHRRYRRRHPDQRLGQQLVGVGVGVAVLGTTDDGRDVLRELDVAVDLGLGLLQLERMLVALFLALRRGRDAPHAGQKGLLVALEVSVVVVRHDTGSGRCAAEDGRRDAAHDAGAVGDADLTEPPAVQLPGEALELDFVGKEEGEPVLGQIGLVADVKYMSVPGPTGRLAIGMRRREGLVHVHEHDHELLRIDERTGQKRSREGTVRDVILRKTCRPDSRIIVR